MSENESFVKSSNTKNLICCYICGGKLLYANEYLILPKSEKIALLKSIKNQLETLINQHHLLMIESFVENAKVQTDFESFAVNKVSGDGLDYINERIVTWIFNALRRSIPKNDFLCETVVILRFKLLLFLLFYKKTKTSDIEFNSFKTRRLLPKFIYNFICEGIPKNIRFVRDNSELKLKSLFFETKKKIEEIFGNYTENFSKQVSLQIKRNAENNKALDKLKLCNKKYLSQQLIKFRLLFCLIYCEIKSKSIFYLSKPLNHWSICGGKMQYARKLLSLSKDQKIALLEFKEKELKRFINEKELLKLQHIVKEAVIHQKKNVKKLIENKTSLDDLDEANKEIIASVIKDETNKETIASISEDESLIEVGDKDDA